MAEEWDNKNNETVSGKLPEGFRIVEENETIPAGYITRMDLALEKTITNAPVSKAASAPVAPITSTKTEKINVDNMTEEDKGMLEVDWGNDKKDDLLKGKTKPVIDQPKSSPLTATVTQPTDPAKFKFGISVVVMVIDFILSNILAKIAGDGEKPTSYTADKTGRETFEESLCLLLDTKRDFIPTWLVVLLAFASAWGFQIMAAIQSRGQKGKAPSEKTITDKDAFKPGLFIGTDGKVYRRYANGAVRQAQFNPDGTEKRVGAPTRVHKAAA